MGPSGAGKTTLIHTLTQQDAYYGAAYGKIKLNGVPLDNEMFRKHCYLVPQHDSNWPHLTVIEILTFAAELYGLDRNIVKDAVKSVIEKVGLKAAATTKSIRLSGGQQRRLSLAVALLKQNQLMVLFLDEPTSGLDAASAACIMREITSVARREGLIVVCTIHQPSSKVFHDFDHLMILSKGREAYVGDSRTSIDYFESIGYPLPPATNGAEHLLDVVNADFSNDVEVDGVLDMWAAERKPLVLEATSSGSRQERSLHDALGIRNQTMISIRRNVLLLFRDTVSYLCRLLGFLVVNSFFGIVYISARKYSQDQAPNKLWVLAWYIGVPANMAVLNVYVTNLELKAIYRETKNGMGLVAAYLISKTLISLPIMFLFSISAIGFPGYFLQDFPSESFWPVLGMWATNIFIWEASSEAMAAMFDQVVVGLLIHTAWWFCNLLFSGYLVPEQDVSFPLVRNIETDAICFSVVLAAQDILLCHAKQLLYSVHCTAQLYQRSMGALLKSIVICCLRELNIRSRRFDGYEAHLCCFGTREHIF